MNIKLNISLFKPWMLAVIPAAIVILAFIGGILHFSSVPHWDSWNGALDPYMHLLEGDLSTFWAVHNEHLIFISRILFAIDLTFFGGRSVFLIAVNYGLIAIGVWVFRRYLIELFNSKTSREVINITAVFIAAWMFSWAQKENLIWEFQSQFFLAQLLPLLSFYYLYRSNDKPLKSKRFFLACLFGILSVGTMANGVLALPLMCVGSLLMGANLKRLAILMLLSVFMLTLYLNNPSMPAKDGSVFASFFQHPLLVLEFTFKYLGNPFHFLVRHNEGSLFYRFIALCAGFAFVVLAGFQLLRFCMGHLSFKQNALQTSLMLFVIYIGGSAFLTACGRTQFGVDTAMSGRYTTPPIMAWVALFILYAPILSPLLKLKGWGQKLAVSCLIIGSIWISYFQTGVRYVDRAFIHKQDVAALALEMGVNDEDYIRLVFPSAEIAILITEKARLKHLSVFGSLALKNVRDKMGQPVDVNTSDTCLGEVASIEQIVNENEYLRIHGWIQSSDRQKTHNTINIVDKNQNLVGYGLKGSLPDVIAASLDKQQKRASFTGYVQASAMDDELTFQNGLKGCSLVKRVNRGPLETKFSDDLPDSSNVSVALQSVENKEGWPGIQTIGGDIAGLTILSSSKNGDQDIGEITVTLQPGDTFYFISGPVPGNQTIDNLEDDAPPFLLPVAEKWQLLEVRDVLSVSKPTRFKLRDNGAGWGEWSAIAVKP